MSDMFKIITSINEAVELFPIIDNPFAPSPFIEQFGNMGNYGSMRFKKISLTDITLWISEYNMTYETVFHAAVDQPILEAHITLNNRMVQSLGKRKSSIFDDREFNVTYAPYMENKVLFPAGGAYTTFDIHPSEKLLERFSVDFPFLNQFLNKKIQQKENVLQLMGHRSFLNFEMENMVRKLLDYISDPFPSKTLITIWAMELLTSFLLRSQNNIYPQYRHHNRHIEALLHAKEIVEWEARTFEDDNLFSSEIGLAEKVGLSIFQLRTGFQRTFGLPINQLRLEIRLQKARLLLSDGKFSVLEVALRTGYQSREGFAKAFKRYYGITPGSVK
ncbi:helix-turn-helix transcriptional regulator [Niabella hibiscisoli]|uniref:helix-turn-helix transcriptional regulator n=1 Tax=Niabella hibiscisoli TaxID=1825928 RepID=UPI00293EA986|nr:helix-turn-helix transcriptional regulator [Niabella hibiscisoli]